MRIVLKVGTSSLVTGGDGEPPLLGIPVIANIVDTVCWLRRRGHEVVLVSSGAVGAGAMRIGLSSKPTTIAQKQALAAVGQVYLLGKYESLFAALQQPCAQVLLTYGNLKHWVQYVNARNTFDELLRIGVVPIVNENDTVAVHELRFGDNDRLSAMVASLIRADWLFILTDVNGLFTAPPSKDPSARRIKRVVSFTDIESLCDTRGGAGTTFGTGGMASKISAAALSTAAGVRTVIMRASDAPNIKTCCLTRGVDVHLSEMEFGTIFEPCDKVVRGRKRWIETLHTRGEIYLDNGAVNAMHRKQTLFAAGVSNVLGTFLGQDAVRVCDVDGHEIGRGIVNFSSDELRVIRGRHSSEINDIVGYNVDSAAVIERANFVLSSELRAGTPPPNASRATNCAETVSIEPEREIGKF